MMRSLESWVESGVLTYLLNSLWQVPLLLVAGWVAARAVRRAGVAAEHRVWVGALVMQCVVPALSSLPLAWLRSMWLWAGEGTPHGAAQVTVAMGPGFGLRGWQPGAGLLAGAAIAYGAVTAYFVARFVWRCAHLAALRSSAVKLDLTGDAALAWSRCVRRLGTTGVMAATSARISVPVTMGIWHRLVLLPERMANGLADAEFRTVTEHEFAHIERNDFAKNLFYELLSLPVSYHPLFWLTRERMVETREMVCDERAAEASGAMEYGRSLLRLAALLVAVPARTPHAMGIFDANTLERRLMRLKNREVEIKGGRRVAMLLACVVFAGVTCASAVALHLSVDAASASSKDGAAKVLTVPAGDMAGNVLSKVMPGYPAEAKKKRIQGTVKLDATISKQGDVQDLKVASGPKELRQSALEAVRQWKYKPYLLNGNPVVVKTTINVIYSLQK